MTSVGDWQRTYTNTKKLFLFQTFERKETYPLSISMAEKFLFSQRKGRENFHPTIHGEKNQPKKINCEILKSTFPKANSWKSERVEEWFFTRISSEMQLKWGSLTGLWFLVISLLLIFESLAEKTSPVNQPQSSSKNDGVFTSSFLIRFRRSVDNDEAHEIAGKHGFESLGPVSTNLLTWKPNKTTDNQQENSFIGFREKSIFLLRFLYVS